MDLGRGKKSTRSATPSSEIYRVDRMLDEGRYVCFVVKATFCGGEMLKNPPLSLSRSLQKTDGESNSGLGDRQQLWGEPGMGVDAGSPSKLTST